MKRIIILVFLVLLLILCFSNIETTQAKSIFVLGKIIKVKQDKHGDYFSPSKISCKVNSICFSIANDTKSLIQVKGTENFYCSLNPTGKILNNNTVCRVNYGMNTSGTWLYYINSSSKPLVVTVT